MSLCRVKVREGYLDKLMMKELICQIFQSVLYQNFQVLLMIWVSVNSMWTVIVKEVFSKGVADLIYFWKSCFQKNFRLYYWEMGKSVTPYYKWLWIEYFIVDASLSPGHSYGHSSATGSLNSGSEFEEFLPIKGNLIFHWIYLLHMIIKNKMFCSSGSTDLNWFDWLTINYIAVNIWLQHSLLCSSFLTRSFN